MKDIFTGGENIVVLRNTGLWTAKHERIMRLEKDRIARMVQRFEFKTGCDACDENAVKSKRLQDYLYKD